MNREQGLFASPVQVSRNVLYDNVCYRIGMAWPTTDDPRTEVVTLRLTKTEMADLEDYARREGVSRSAAVRTALEMATELPKTDSEDDQETEEET